MTLLLQNSEPANIAAESRSRKVVTTVAAVLGLLVLGAILGGYIYWRSFADTPQYSLALLVDAARRDDQAKVDEIVAVDAIVDDFVPQITDKAVELYGRGLPPQTIARVAKVVRRDGDGCRTLS